MVNAEYRWDASPILDMVVFADAGKVFNRWEQWNFHNLESDVGFSLRFKARYKDRFQFRHRLQPRGISNMVSRKQRNLITRDDCCAAFTLAFSPAFGRRGRLRGNSIRMIQCCGNRRHGR